MLSGISRNKQPRQQHGATLLTVDVSAEVDLADVVVLQDGGVSGVGGVVGGAVVQGTAGGEGQAGVQPVLLDQLTGTILQTLAEPRGVKRNRCYIF